MIFTESKDYYTLRLEMKDKDIIINNNSSSDRDDAFLFVVGGWTIEKIKNPLLALKQTEKKTNDSWGTVQRISSIVVSWFMTTGPSYQQINIV